jgi:hypothetical protein
MRPTRSYRRLDADEVIETARRLARRVDERFPGSGLGRVAAELVVMAGESAERARWIARPNLWLRAGVGLLVVAAIAGGVGLVRSLDLRMAFADNLSDALQGLEAGVNELVLLGVAVFFLFTLEGRLKRARALAALHELRSIAHIIDMHQLTKDPERLHSASDTASSPRRNLAPAELSRYLDYCSELLSIVSKVAAIYAEHFRDPVALSAVDELESLVSGLSRKIWQKIMIVIAQPDSGPGEGAPAPRPVPDASGAGGEG